MYHLYLLYFISTFVAALLGVYWMHRSQRLNSKYPFFRSNHDARGRLLAVIIIAGPLSIILMLFGIGRATLIDKQDFRPIWSW